MRTGAFSSFTMGDISFVIWEKSTHKYYPCYVVDGRVWGPFNSIPEAVKHARRTVLARNRLFDKNTQIEAYRKKKRLSREFDSVEMAMAAIHAMVRRGEIRTGWYTKILDCMYGWYIGFDKRASLKLFRPETKDCWYRLDTTMEYPRMGSSASEHIIRAITKFLCRI